tara:strand:+ start:1159 stop:1944 length:786 start_codon:yes stop_codon:yes gene_type:complete
MEKLKNKTIVITRSTEQSSVLRDYLMKLQVNVLDLPSLIIGPPNNIQPLENALAQIKTFDWIIFSSVNGVKSIDRQLKFKNKSLKEYNKFFKIASIGIKTANYLNQIGVEVDFIPPQFVSDSLVNNFPFLNNKSKILIPRVESGGRTILSNSLKKIGAEIIEVPAYESYCPSSIPDKTLKVLKQNLVDAITFTSSKTVLHAYKLINQYFDSNINELFNNLKIVSIGPSTSVTCRKVFGRVDQEAKIHDINGLIAACNDCFH